MALGNHTTLNGRLGRDPEVRFTKAGSKVANISLATDRYYRDSKGESQKETIWHRGVLFGALALRAEQYLVKGKEILFEGYNRTREWTDQAGVERYTTEIVCENFRMVGATPASTASPVDPEDPAQFGYGNANLAQEAAGGGPDVPF